MRKKLKWTLILGLIVAYILLSHKINDLIIKKFNNDFFNSYEWYILFSIIFVSVFLFSFIGFPTYIAIIIFADFSPNFFIFMTFAFSLEFLCYYSHFTLARTFLKKRIDKKFKDNKNLKIINNSIEVLGYYAIIIIRTLPNFTYEVQNYLLSLTNVKKSVYLLWSFLMSIPVNIFIYWLIVYKLDPSFNLSNIFIVFILIITLNLFILISIIFILRIKDRKKYIYSLNEIKEIFNKGIDKSKSK